MVVCQAACAMSSPAPAAGDSQSGGNPETRGHLTADCRPFYSAVGWFAELWCSPVQCTRNSDKIVS